MNKNVKSKYRLIKVLFMLSYTIFFMLDICFDSLLVSNEVKNVFPTSGVYKNMNYLANGWL